MAREFRLGPYEREGELLDCRFHAGPTDLIGPRHHRERPHDPWVVGHKHAKPLSTDQEPLETQVAERPTMVIALTHNSLTRAVSLGILPPGR